MSLLAPGSARDRRIGIALMCVVALCYSCIDVVAKYLVASLPVMQVVWLRFVTHAVLGVVVLTPTYGWRLFTVRHPGLQLLRGVMLAGMTGLNMWALVYLQLDITAAIQFSVPILVAVISARWLGEGWLVFGHVPDALVVVGATIVVGSGLFLLYREFRPGS